MNQIRKAEERDIPRIHELLRQVNGVHHDGRPDIFREGGRKYNDEQLRILFEDSSRPVFVSVNENNVVEGYCFCMITEYRNNNIIHDMKELYIDDLCVDENTRGSGVGHELYEFVKGYAKEEGCYHLTLNVWACNPGAMAFYERQGLQMLKKEMEVIL